MCSDKEDSNLISDIPFKEANITEEKLEVLVREIKFKSEKIKNIYNSFNSKNDYGYSLITLYEYTDQSLNIRDPRYRYYTSISKSELFKKLTKDEVIKALDIIEENKLMKSYFKYKKFLNNHTFDVILQNSEIKDYEGCISKISGLLNNSFALLPPIYNNKYTRAFIENKIFYKKPSDEELLEIVKKINNEENGFIIKKYQEKSGYSVVKWISSIINKEKKIKDYNEYNALETEIFNQYKENIECLKIFIKSFKFLSKAVKQEEIDKLPLYVLNEDELSFYLEDIKSKLIKYVNFLKLQIAFEKLNNSYKEVLEFIYDNVNTLDESADLIEFLYTKFYEYQYIAESEAKNRFIDEYEKIDFYYESLLKSVEYICSYDYPHKNILTVLNQLYASDNIKKDEEAKESIYIKEVLKLISSWGYVIKHNFYVDGYKADYAIFNKDNKEDVLIIFFDITDSYNNEDIKRAIYFKYHNINTYYLWSRNWWYKRNSEIIRLRATLNNYL